LEVRGAGGQHRGMSSSTLRHDHIALRVSDYAATVEWYTTKLGFRVDEEWPFGDIELSAPAR
jgi:catechol-2,3-dioxygenase